MQLSSLSDKNIYFHIIVNLLNTLDKIINPNGYQYLVTPMIGDTNRQIIKYRLFSAIKAFNKNKLLKVNIQLIEYDPKYNKIIKYHNTICNLSTIESDKNVYCEHCGRTSPSYFKIAKITWTKLFKNNEIDYKKINSIITKLLYMKNINDYNEYKYLL